MAAMALPPASAPARHATYELAASFCHPPDSSPSSALPAPALHNPLPPPRPRSLRCRLDSAEVAALQYEKRDKKGGPSGGEVFNEKSLYKAHQKRVDNIPYTAKDYEAAKARDPEFYRWVVFMFFLGGGGGGVCV